MEKYQMSRPGCRPYNRTCGMARTLPADRAERMIRQGASPRDEGCGCRMPGTQSRDAEMYSHLQYLEPAMAYVPCQNFTVTFELPYALRAGTVFPELCKPFCGKRGGRR